MDWNSTPTSLVKVVYAGFSFSRIFAPDGINVVRLPCGKVVANLVRFSNLWLYLAEIAYLKDFSEDFFKILQKAAGDASRLGLNLLTF